MIRVLFICHGNICRSTMAQSVMAHLVREQHLEDWIAVDSAATSTEEIGNPPHYGTVDKLNQVGIPVVPHRAVQMTRKDYDRYDYLIGMDSANIRNMQHICGGDSQQKIHMLLDFTREPGAIADPWYTGNFDVTYEDVLRGCQGLLAHILAEHKG